MRSYCCNLQGYQEYSLFVGCLLSKHDKKLDAVRKSREFRKEFEVSLQDFYSIYTDYNIRNLEKYIGRYEILIWKKHLQTFRLRARAHSMNLLIYW